VRVTEAATSLDASYARRFAALFVDWILCVLVSGFFANPFTDGWAPVVVLIVVYAFFVGLFGQTPGMRLFGLTCLDVRTAKPVGVPKAALRGLLLALVIPALMLDSDRRGLHDRVAGTVITRAQPARV
jgi:uncharacterized RDD family membrane protein YckC